MAGRVIYKLHQKRYTDNIMSNITIDELARMSQSEFTAVRGEIQNLHTEMNQKFDLVFTGIDEIKSLIQNEVRDLKSRVTRVEETIGIGK